MIEFNTRKHILQKLYFVVWYVMFSYGNKSQQESKPTINLIILDVNPVCPGKVQSISIYIKEKSLYRLEKGKNNA